MRWCGTDACFCFANDVLDGLRMRLLAERPWLWLSSTSPPARPGADPPPPRPSVPSRNAASQDRPGGQGGCEVAVEAAREAAAEGDREGGVAAGGKLGRVLEGGCGIKGGGGAASVRGQQRRRHAHAAGRPRARGVGGVGLGCCCQQIEVHSRGHFLRAGGGVQELQAQRIPCVPFHQSRQVSMPSCMTSTVATQAA